MYEYSYISHVEYMCILGCKYIGDAARELQRAHSASEIRLRCNALANC